jgi:hypothetical protein
MTNDAITAERLREVLDYDPSTGLFRWRMSLGARAVTGEIAGSQKPSGYICINVDGVRYRAHRLAWLYMTGEHPPLMVDHKDNVRNHNQWDNLRLATNQENGRNSRKKRFNTSGHKGVFWSKQRSKWCAKINVQQKQIHLGFHDCKSDAVAAYARGARQHFGEFARYDRSALKIDLVAVHAEIKLENALFEFRSRLRA